ncbi:MAG: amidohydrolase [Oscillospiraceae bacterium]|jgi:5-methylthioadenosine/S-adenosylhomocysteine deaminase|nr:amidohydrolase [Oscillospiraceae bacterium]
MNILIKDILAALPDGEEICSVYISDGVITSTSETPGGFTADKTIFGTGKMLIPGLINAHTHASMSIFRNCADDLLFNDWLFGKIMPLEDKLTGEDCYWSMMLSVMEMLRSGTTSFIDMYYFMDDLARAVEESGIRAVLSRGLTGGADDPLGGEKRLREALDAAEFWKGRENISFMLAPHAPYTCDEGYQREVASEARRLGFPINTHLAESLAEIDTIREKYGCTPFELADRTGLLSDTTVAAHCVHLSENDISILARRGVNVVTNPVSNLKLANGVAPVPKLLNAGVKVALGTDSAASNNSLNMFRDLSMLSLIHKGVNHDAQAVSAREGFDIATKNGAAAMGRSDIGQIKPGNLADLAILDLDRPNMQPVNNHLAALVYSANGSEIETVLVGGRILMENREFLTIDSERVYREVDNICKRIGTR